MSKRHYTCRRSGEDLLVVEADEGEIVRRGIAVAVGAVLLWEGARRSGLWAALCVAAGAELCARGTFGQSLAGLFTPGNEAAAPADALQSSFQQSQGDRHV